MIGLALDLGCRATPARTLAPWQAPPLPFPATAVYDFDAGLQAWTRSSPTGQVAIDAGLADAGKAQSLRILTEAPAQTADAHVTGLNPNRNLAGKVIRVRLRVDALPRLGYARLAVLNEGNANYSAVDLLTHDSGVAESGEWVTVELTRGDLSAAAVDMASIDRIMLRASPLAAANPVQTNVQSIALRDEPAAGCLVLAFDDGWRGQRLNAFPAMQAAGLRGCVYAICDQHIATSGLYMSRGELHELQDAGWDIGCHADTIANHNAAAGFTGLEPTAFDAACRAMKAWQVAHGFRSDHFAWPRGKHTAAHRAVAARYFSSQRTFRSNLNRFEADIYPFADAGRLRQCAVAGGATPSPVATVTALIDACMAARKTLILTFHDIGNGGGGSEYPVASFAAVVGHIASRAYPVKTLTRIFARGV
jgi:hypothetical protein